MGVAPGEPPTIGVAVPFAESLSDALPSKPTPPPPILSRSGDPTGTTLPVSSIAFAEPLRLLRRRWRARAIVDGSFVSFDQYSTYLYGAGVSG